MAKNSDSLSNEDIKDLVQFCAEYAADPLGFVCAAFPWGEGELEGYNGPNDWQRKELLDIELGLKTPERVIYEATASGNGVGKSALVSWLILWSISTFEDTKGIVTANTDTQLRTKTWAELAKWYRLSVSKPMFEMSATALYSKDAEHEKTWRIDAIPWSENNPEAFAGLHNKGKRILIIFDEASAIADVIWETIQGALTDSNTEIIMAVFGNPTRNSGRFYDCFHKYRAFWNTLQVDSRNVPTTNKPQIQEWLEMYGEDSDFFKVHVRGLFPNISDAQLISAELIAEAQRRYKDVASHKERLDGLPVIFGVDPAWTGSDLLVVYMRQGNYSKVLLEMPYNDNDVFTAQKLAALQDEYHMTAGFIDFGYGTGIYSALKTMGRGDKWTLVNFAEAPTDPQYANKRAEIWCTTKQWLKDGGAIEPDKPQIGDDLAGPQAFINKRSKLQLESKDDMKKRGLASPNYGDALALTHSQPVLRESKFDKFAEYRKRGKLHKYGSM